LLFLFPDNQPKVASKERQVSRTGGEMKRLLLAGALLLAVATLGPITRFVRFWARCAKRRHQEAMIYLAYDRGLITKAEIDGMLKQVDQFDGSCLSVIAERKRQWQQQPGEDERGISTRAILSRLENWVTGGLARTEMVPDAMSTAAGPTGGIPPEIEAQHC
jgi:hypothetical protein